MLLANFLLLVQVFSFYYLCQCAEVNNRQSRPVYDPDATMASLRSDSWSSELSALAKARPKITIRQKAALLSAALDENEFEKLSFIMKAFRIPFPKYIGFIGHLIQFNKTPQFLEFFLQNIEFPVGIPVNLEMLGSLQMKKVIYESEYCDQYLGVLLKNICLRQCLEDKCTGGLYQKVSAALNIMDSHDLSERNKDDPVRPDKLNRLQCAIVREGRLNHDFQTEKEISLRLITKLVSLGADINENVLILARPAMKAFLADLQSLRDHHRNFSLMMRASDDRSLFSNFPSELCKEVETYLCHNYEILVDKFISSSK